MSLETKGFEFGVFFLDTQDKVLRQGDNIVHITPKAFLLLHFLVENNLRLIEREELIRAVWTDSFVEEGNLTFTIRLLRKALSDNPQNPHFIETVSRRGYRFIAEVKEVFIEAESRNPTENLTIEISSPTGTGKSEKPIISTLAVGILLFSIIFAGVWYVQSRHRNSGLPFLDNSFSSEKITTDGKAFPVIISADGKNIFYINRNNGKPSVWLRQMDSSNNIELLSASDYFYGGLALSPDGNYLYFSRLQKGQNRQFDIYRISIFGGVPEKLIDDSQGLISISPDGTKISFVRCFHLESENCSLWTADSRDGTNQQKLTSRPPPYRIADNKFSPDGKKIAFAAGQSKNAANEFGLLEIGVEGGAEHEISKEKFFDIRSLEWLPDQSGVVFAASRIPNQNFHIWRTHAGSDKIDLLTKDAESYITVSLDKTATNLVATKLREDFHLNLLNLQTPSKKQLLTNASTANFMPDGRILFSSTMSGNEEIWVVNPDGSGQKQLTNNSSDDTKPVASPDKKSIYFGSNRTGAVHIWRMNADGSNQTQITHQEGGVPLLISPDEEWIYYQHGIDKTLRRVSANGEHEEMVLDKPAYRMTVSPDAAQVAYTESNKAGGRILKINSLITKKPTAVFKPVNEKAKVVEIGWLPDGKSLVYIQVDENYENYTLWLQTIDGHESQQISDLGNEEVAESTGFAVSPDGKFLTLIQGGWRFDTVLLKGLR